MQAFMLKKAGRVTGTKSPRKIADSGDMAALCRHIIQTQRGKTSFIERLFQIKFIM